MRFRFLVLGALLAGCRESNQPLSPTRSPPQFSQVPGNGPEKITFHSNRTANFDIFVMNADGSGVTQLTSHPFADLLPLFSPDGSRIVFGRCGGDTCDVVVINADGSGERTIVSDGFPGAWSPDGNQIALSRSEGLWIINADGTGLHRVAESQGVNDWSPDGRQLMVARGDDELYALNLDGSGVTQLTHNSCFDHSGTGWSPDGTRIVFSNDCDGDLEILVMNADGSGVQQLTHNGLIDDASPVWSPDGTRIAFDNADPRGPPPGDAQIFVMNADGSDITQLTFGVGVNNSGPHWIRQISPSNDNFANATGISSLPFTGIAQLPLASVEPGEPMPSCANFAPPSKTVWYSFTPRETQSISARIGNASVSPVVAAYSGNLLGSLTELGCLAFGGSVTFRAQAGTTYHFLVGGLSGESGQVEFRLEVTPPPVANFFFFPGDPSIFDQVQFQDFSFDPAFIGFEPPHWSFGDGATGSGFFPTHRYAADGDYVVEETVTTLDGRSASTSSTLQVRTRDVAITRFQAPTTGMTGKTSRITVDIRSNRYPETVQVQLFKSVPGGFQLVATSTQTLPTRNRVTSVAFSYTFTPEDAIIGKVTFKAVASLLSGRDALPADNEAIAPPTRVNR